MSGPIVASGHVEELLRCMIEAEFHVEKIRHSCRLPPPANFGRNASPAMTARSDVQQG
jgi:hypothetical protein